MDKGLAKRPSESSMSASQSSPRRQLQRIHFPQSNSQASEAGSSASSPIGAGLRSLEGRSSRYPNRLSQSQASTSAEPPNDPRRRVRSVGNASDALRPSDSYSRSQNASAYGTTRSTETSRRHVSHNPESWTRAPRSGSASIGSSPLATGALLPAEEEPQGAGEDAKIMAELRNALQFKPHIEQHLSVVSPLVGAPVSTLPSTAHTTPYNLSSTAFGSKSPLPLTIPLSEPQTPSRNEFIDFSPSIGTASLHPIPSSSDDCATLDWSSMPPEDEKRDRRWTLSLTRRHSSDKNLKHSRKALVEKQERAFEEKLLRIREKIDQSTQRKAAIVKNQLERRYSVINVSYSPGATRFNPFKSLQWFHGQEESYKRLVAEEEPAFWLQHLHLRSHEGEGGKRDSQWNLTALIAEQYMQIVNPNLAFPSQVQANEGASDTSSMISAPLVRKGTTRPISMTSMEQELIRRASDDRLSYEPSGLSIRGSIDASSRASADTQARRWRNSLGGVEKQGTPISNDGQRSRRQTTSSDQYRPYNGRGSPISRRSLQAIGVKKRSLKSPASSEAEKSSGGETRDKENSRHRHTSDGRRSRFHLSLDLRSNQSPMDDDKHRTVPKFSLADLRTDAFPSNTSAKKSQSLPLSSNLDASVSQEAFERFDHSQRSQNSDSFAVKTPKAPTQRLSLPPQLVSTSSRVDRRRRRTDAQSQALDDEYKRKKNALDTLVTRNNRLKQVLQTASKAVKDREECQRKMSKKLSLPFEPLSQEVLEALSHDPSGVTGHLQHARGWQAVEEIHARLAAQRDILQSFVAGLANSSYGVSIPEKGICDEAVDRLKRKLDKLQTHRDAVASKYKRAEELLMKVKGIRDDLKRDFDDTSKHTSANYPELVHLEDLLDRVVTKKNQLWRIFEAIISFSLTSVAPLMKTFGRPIWNELHDFLVIPLYRNDFSGEDHWYPVTFPRRGFFHWLRLLAFAFFAPLALLHGSHFFIDLITKGYLIRIPPFIPSFVVHFFFWSLMCSFASLLSTLLFVVLCELFVVLWWTAWLLHIVQ